MPVVTKHEPGMFCWADLSTTDRDGARRFYTALFGWTAEDMPMGPGQTYTMLYKDGQTVAALYQQQPAQKGLPAMWSNYVAVTSVDETVGKVEVLGGKVILPPDDVFDSGRMAFLQDPGGAIVGLWQPKAHIGAGRYGDPDSLAWAELLTRDTAAAERFYAGLFGWTTEPMKMEAGVYTVFNSGGKQAGGMMDLADLEKSGEMPTLQKLPPFWMVYFAVSDTAATVARVKELGGQVFFGPNPVPEVGIIATVADPQGGTFSVIQPKM